MRFSRFLAALTAAMLLVVYSGCGGDEKKDPGSTSSGGATQAKAGEMPRAVRPFRRTRRRLMFPWSRPIILRQS